MTSTNVLVIDNYDSFVYTLVGYLRQLGAQVRVIRNDEYSLEETTQLATQADGVLISPGPGNPAGAGVSMDLIRACVEKNIPLYGVCLGLQSQAEALGGVVSHAEQLMHGRTSLVEHTGHPMFEGVANPFTATRYHSLAVQGETVPEELEVTARTHDGVIMGIAHKTALAWCVQFHPESVLTQDGYRMLGNWLEALGLTGAAEHASRLSPLISSPQHA
ncbi:anthranilate synthase component II [Pseudoglutamicibacter cumminsii]|uniref:anthranilate synthase component II n=1 Tax=Pseudoglutamicibacter cumminsii TaxID=156979 RepID=UPI00195DEF6B|nr:aminodeoxychorismate/anthranilate synthase component II [Pseudoglutamicibacter cumminsii]MBM7795954.1 para-aminobenzoate synthetase component 2 [Pseudoglutamicibacter cumminsii]